MTFCPLPSILQPPGQVPSVEIMPSVPGESRRHSLQSSFHICLADLLHPLSVPSCSCHCSVVSSCFCSLPSGCCNSWEGYACSPSDRCVFWCREVETTRETLVSSLANSAQNQPACGGARLWTVNHPSSCYIRFSPRVLARTKHFGFSSFLQGSGFWILYIYF